MRNISAAIMILFLLSLASAQQAPKPSSLDDLRFLVGEWEGAFIGRPGRDVLKRGVCLTASLSTLLLEAKGWNVKRKIRDRTARTIGRIQAIPRMDCAQEIR